MIVGLSIFAIFLQQPWLGASRTSPFPASPVISGINFADKSTIIYMADGSDNWPITWGDDDKLYTAFGDGWGFIPMLPDKACLGTASIDGQPATLTAKNLAPIPGGNCHKATGIIMVSGTLYLWTRRDNGRLWKSTNQGRSWQDTGITMEQPDLSFYALHFLQFGKNYDGARDGFVYIYGTHKGETKPGDIYIFRAPKDKIDIRNAYEFYTGLDESNEPVWSQNIAKRTPIISDPGRGRDARIVYNPGINRYILSYTWYGPRKNGNIALLDAPEPWGPWTTVYYSDNWEGAFTFEYTFPQKWMSKDGKTMYMIYSGVTSKNNILDAFVLRKVTLDLHPSVDAIPPDALGGIDVE